MHPFLKTKNISRDQRHLKTTLGIQQSKPQMLPREGKLRQTRCVTPSFYDRERYQFAILWKSDSPALPNNYEMAYSRLNATYKRLIPQNSIGENYKQNITSHVEKVCSRRGQKSERTPKCLVLSSLSGVPL